jgi:hypothetical protein
MCIAENSWPYICWVSFWIPAGKPAGLMRFIKVGLRPFRQCQEYALLNCDSCLRKSILNSSFIHPVIHSFSHLLSYYFVLQSPKYWQVHKISNLIKDGQKGKKCIFIIILKRKEKEHLKYVRKCENNIKVEYETKLIELWAAFIWRTFSRGLFSTSWWIIHCQFLSTCSTYVCSYAHTKLYPKYSGLTLYKS